MSGSRRRADPALIAALIEGKTVVDAAKAAGISEATARRRIKEPEIRAQITEGQAEIVEAAINTLTASAQLAALTIRTLLGRAAPDSVRLAAAKEILSAVRGRDLDARLAKIEETLFPAPTALPPSITTITEKRG
jgi:hypothetical protein